MALIKSQIVAEISNKSGFTRKKSADAVETLLEIIKSTLSSGEDLLISGFGKFCVKEKNPRRGRNPATGETMMLASRKVVTFKCSQKLRKQINGK
jgi:integration host factor subunit alpha